jgi:hypothetical protein
MKKIMTMALLLGSLALIQSCSKDGEVGPQGPKGDTGATGAAGQNGVSGAVAFEFTNKGSSFDEVMAIGTKADSCAVMVYYKDASLTNLWYAAPGLGPNATYQTRYYIQPGASSTNIRFNIYNPDGSSYTGSTVTFAVVKVVFIPHTLGKKDAVDYSDYMAVAKYYGLKD